MLLDGWYLGALTWSYIVCRDVTRHLKMLLRKEGLTFRTSAEFEIVRTIKEKACYVAFNPQKEEQLEIDRNADKSNYVLPDGQQVKVNGAT